MVPIAFNRVNHHNLCNRATLNAFRHLDFDVVDSSIRTWEHIKDLAHDPSSLKGILICHCNHISNLEVSTFYRYNYYYYLQVSSVDPAVLLGSTLLQLHIIQWV